MYNIPTPEEAAKKFGAKQLASGYILEAIHEYKYTQGRPVYWRIRFKHPSGDKWIRPMHLDQYGEYDLSEPEIFHDNLKLLYGVWLIKDFPDAISVIVEGEYKADILNAFFIKNNAQTKYVAITSGSSTSAERANWRVLVGKECIIWPDFDSFGLDYANEVFAKLSALGCKAKIIDVRLLDLPEGGDCADWIASNPDYVLNDFLSMHFTVPASIPAQDLDAGGSDAWYESVDPSSLLTEICNVVRQFIVCSETVAYAITLWIVMTWFVDVIRVCPLAVITAPEKRCGKSNLLALMGKLVKNPMIASNITSASIFRTIAAFEPTLLIDEADTFLKNDEESRGILNAGHTRDSSYIIRLVGKDYIPTPFNVWGAKAIAGIGKIADTLMDRAIEIPLNRKTKNEKVEKIRDYGRQLRLLKSKIKRFSQDFSEVVNKSHPGTLEELNDREQDNWEPLFAIAEVANEEWLRRAHESALILSSNNNQEIGESIQLLFDMQEIFKLTDRVHTDHLIKKLCVDKENIWATNNNGHKVTARKIAILLKGFNVSSKTMRISGVNAKGYSADMFTDIFNRYLPKAYTTMEQ